MKQCSIPQETAPSLKIIFQVLHRTWYIRYLFRLIFLLNLKLHSTMTIMQCQKILTLIRVGFLGVPFEVGDGVKITPLSKTHQNYARNLKIGMKVQTHMQFQKISFSTKALLILLMPAFFFQKISVFWLKQYLYSKQQCESCVRFFSSVFTFYRIKSYY